MGPSENDLRAPDTGRSWVTEDGTMGACGGAAGEMRGAPGHRALDVEGHRRLLTHDLL